MLDNCVTRAGTLLYKGGKIYIDGWELKDGGMCREHVIFACLYVAQELCKAAMANIREPGGAENTCADMPRETPREWLCAETQSFDAMFDGDEWSRAIDHVEALECGIKGCPLPKHHHLLPDSHPHRWCRRPEEGFGERPRVLSTTGDGAK